MEPNQRAALEKAGWTFGDASDFLGLSEEDRQLLEFRLMVSREIRRLRESLDLTQRQLADRMGSSQSWIAKVESGSHDVSLDLMLRGFFAVGGRFADLVGPATSSTKGRKARDRSA